jgi:hypothetical protein
LIGQWAPIVGTGLALLGSLYLLFAVKPKAAKPTHQCNCSMKEVDRGLLTASSDSEAAPDATDMYGSFPNNGGGTLSEMVPITSQSGSGQTDAGNRRKVARTLRAVGKYLGTPAHGLFDDSEFKHGKALDFPEIPGEEHRNPDLPQIREQYNQARDADGNVTPGRPSRAGSITNSVISGLDIEGSSTRPRVASPSPPSSPSPLPFSSPTTPRILHASTLPAERPSVERQNHRSSSSAGTSAGGQRLWRDTLQVPSAAHHRPM